METIAPESLLASNPKDKNFGERIIRNYELLLNEWQNFKATSFIGAGTSVSLGVEGWEELASELKTHVLENYREAALEMDWEKESDLPVLFEKLFNVFVLMKKEDEFNELIFKKMEPLYNSTTLTLIKLVLLVNLHITTNFDLSIEKAYLFLEYLANYFSKKNDKKLKTYSIPKLPPFIEVSRDGLSHLLYLHGKKNEKYILRSSDYEQFYLSPKNNGEYSKCIEETLKSFLKEASLLFIGFSFNDIRVKDALFGLIAEIRRDKLINERFAGSTKTSSPKHFLLIHDSPNVYGSKKWEDFFDEFESRDIYPIIYEEDNHIFLEHLFDYLKRKEAAI